jgi:hypothetical protein
VRFHRPINSSTSAPDSSSAWRCSVLYSRVPDGVQRIVDGRYELVRTSPIADDSRSRLYDQQDALFLPLTGLAGVERMGPTFEIYRAAPIERDHEREPEARRSGGHLLISWPLIP